MMKPFALALVALFALGATKPPSTSGISLDPRAWQVRYSSGVTLQPLSGMAGWSFVFPAAPGHVNYLTTSFTTPIAQTQAVTFTAQIVTLSGSPIFDYGLGPDNPCQTPATVRVYLEQVYNPKGPGHDITFAPATYRWWANPITTLLLPGVYTVTVPFTPDQWSDTDGQSGVDQPLGFAEALAHPAAIGMTFGGGCFFGHGVSVSGGAARFVLTNFQIQ